MKTTKEEQIMTRPTPQYDASKHGGRTEKDAVEWATKGRNRIWIEGDDVKMWQLRSGLLNRCESGAFVWRDEWILTPSSPLPVLNRRLVGGRKRLMIMSGCHLRHFSFR